MVPPSRTFETPHGTLRWERAGPETGRPLVLVHGTPFSSAIWARVAPVLAARAPVITLDLPGYGASDKPGRVSLDVLGEAFATFMDAVAGPDAVVAAHDFGAAAALRAHLLHGADYARLILMNPVAVGAWGSPFMRHVRAHEAAFAGLPAYAHRALFQAYVSTSSARGFDAPTLDALTAPWTGEAGQSAFYRQIAQADTRFTAEIEDKIPALRCDYDLLWSLDDAWLPAEAAERLRALKAPARFHAFAGAGHALQLDAPEEVAAFILEGLAAGQPAERAA